MAHLPVKCMRNEFGGCVEPGVRVKMKVKERWAGFSCAHSAAVTLYSHVHCSTAPQALSLQLASFMALGGRAFPNSVMWGDRSQTKPTCSSIQNLGDVEERKTQQLASALCGTLILHRKTEALHSKCWECVFCLLTTYFIFFDLFCWCPTKKPS